MKHRRHSYLQDFKKDTNHLVYDKNLWKCVYWCIIHNPTLLQMDLTPPKRLFNVATMQTVLYKDVVDDVKEKGYAAISHVWGKRSTNQKSWEYLVASTGKFLCHTLRS